MIHLLIDADSCPVIDIALSVSSRYEMKPILFCDTSHRIERDNIKTIIVPKGADSVDFKLVNMLKKGDVVITNDLGLAAMCIAKGAYVVDSNGKYLTADNIDSMLGIRYEHAKIRRAGGRIKGPKKRTEKNNIAFEMNFRQICEQVVNGKGDSEK